MTLAAVIVPHLVYGQPVLLPGETSRASKYADDLDRSPFLNSDVRPARNDIENDKVLHAAFSFLIVAHVHLPLHERLDFSRNKSLLIGAGTALASGVLKESLDAIGRNGSGFDWLDILADLVGIAAASILLYTLP